MHKDEGGDGVRTRLARCSEAGDERVRTIDRSETAGCMDTEEELRFLLSMLPMGGRGWSGESCCWREDFTGWDFGVELGKKMHVACEDGAESCD